MPLVLYKPLSELSLRLREVNNELALKQAQIEERMEKNSQLDEETQDLLAKVERNEEIVKGFEKTLQVETEAYVFMMLLYDVSVRPDYMHCRREKAEAALQEQKQRQHQRACAEERLEKKILEIQAESRAYEITWFFVSLQSMAYERTAKDCQQKLISLQDTIKEINCDLDAIPVEQLQEEMKNDVASITAAKDKLRQTMDGLSLEEV